MHMVCFSKRGQGQFRANRGESGATCNNYSPMVQRAGRFRHGQHWSKCVEKAPGPPDHAFPPEGQPANPPMDQGLDETTQLIARPGRESFEWI
jgi:hypothetical protein